MIKQATSGPQWSDSSLAWPDIRVSSLASVSFFLSPNTIHWEATLQPPKQNGLPPTATGLGATLGSNFCEQLGFLHLNSELDSNDSPWAKSGWLYPSKFQCRAAMGCQGGHLPSLGGFVGRETSEGFRAVFLENVLLSPASWGPLPPPRRLHESSFCDKLRHSLRLVRTTEDPSLSVLVRMGYFCCFVF